MYKLLFACLSTPLPSNHYRYMSLSLALRYVLESLKKPPSSKMYLFGLAALDKFKSRLHEFSQYCASISSIPHFPQFPQILIRVYIIIIIECVCVGISQAVFVCFLQKICRCMVCLYKCLRCVDVGVYAIVYWLLCTLPLNCIARYSYTVCPIRPARSAVHRATQHDPVLLCQRKQL